MNPSTNQSGGTSDTDSAGLSSPLRTMRTDASTAPGIGVSNESVAQWSLKEIHRIARRVLADQPVELYLFGSWARGDARHASDIDIAVLPIGTMDPFVLAKFRSALEESHIPYRVDVVSLDTTSDEFRRRVLEEGIRWPL